MLQDERTDRLSQPGERNRWLAASLLLTSASCTNPRTTRWLLLRGAGRLFHTLTRADVFQAALVSRSPAGFMLLHVKQNGITSGLQKPGVAGGGQSRIRFATPRQPPAAPDFCNRWITPSWFTCNSEASLQNPCTREVESSI